jgi:hypothetical protein
MVTSQVAVHMLLFYYIFLFVNGAKAAYSTYVYRISHNKIFT